MPSARSQTPFMASRLTPRQIDQVLGLAVEQSATVLLAQEGTPSLERLTTELVDRNQGSLFARATDGSTALPALQASARWTGTLMLEENCFLFETGCVGVKCREDGTIIELLRPTVMMALERRRQRRKLMPSRPVRIRSLGGAPAGAGGSLEGALMNLSEHGLACRCGVAALSACGLTLKEPVEVELELRPGEPAIRIRATLVNQVPSSAAGEVVVGLEFEESQQQALGQVAQALAEARW